MRKECGMRRFLIGLTLPGFLLCLSAPLNGQVQTTVGPDQAVIIAQGDSLLMLPPDRAYVQIGVEGRGAKPADAQRLAANAMTSVQAALKALGFTADMMRTMSYVLQPEYESTGGERKVRDYLARNVVEVRVDELARLSDVLDSAGTSGAASVNGLRFDLKNRSAAELDALHRAVRDATERAQAMAEGAGRSLGPIVRLQEQRTSPASPVFQAGVAVDRVGRGGIATPVDPGEIQVRAQVILTVAIQ
jgi:uncharacterized protein YggE